MLLLLLPNSHSWLDQESKGYGLRLSLSALYST